MDLKSILFINLDRIGDVIRSTFLFRALRERYPHAYIAALAATPADELLCQDPAIDSVLTLPHQEIRALVHKKKTVLHMCLPVFQLLDALKIHTFDLVINPFSDFGALIVRYLAPRYMLGRALDKRGKFVVYGQETAKFVYIMSNQEKLRERLQLNFAEVYSRILEDIGISIPESRRRPHVYLSPREHAFAQEFLQAEGVGSDDIVVGLQVGAFSQDKMWPIDKFIALGERIQQEFEAYILLNGSQHEAHTLCRKMQQALGTKVIIAAGRTSLMQAAALIKRCCLFVSNDTGPMHMAAAVGTPVVALFGVEQSIPAESKPWGEGHTVIAKQRISEIAVDEVCRAVREKLKSQLIAHGS